MKTNTAHIRYSPAHHSAGELDSGWIVEIRDDKGKTVWAEFHFKINKAIAAATRLVL